MIRNSTTKSRSERSMLLARFSKGVDALAFNEETLEAFMHQHTGKKDTRDMSMDELRFVEMQLHDMVVRMDTWSKSKMQMTLEQAKTLCELSQELGWEGIYDVRLRNFASRILKTHFQKIEVMSEKQATRVISSLRDWVKGVKQRVTLDSR